MIVWPAFLLVGLLPGYLWWRDRHDRRTRLPAVEDSADTPPDLMVIEPPAILRARIGARSLQVLPPGLRPGIANWRFWSSVSLVILALARPQWQAPEAAQQPAPQAQVVVVMEYSEAMLAADLMPSRLERARSVAMALLDGLEDAAVAVIGYAGEAHVLAPMSRDQSAARRLLASLAPRHFLHQGADLNGALDLAAGQFSAAADTRLLLVLALGEQRGPSAVGEGAPALPARLRTGDVDLLVVGAGTPEGSLLPDEVGQPRLGDGGSAQVTRLDRQSLQGLADHAGGRYVGAGDRVALRQALADVVAGASARGERELRNQPTQARIDVFGWLLLAAMLLLTWSLCCEFSGRELLAWRWRLRYREPRSGPGAAALLLVLALGLPERGQTQAPAEEELHAGDPYLKARVQIQQLAATPQPTAADYLAFAEVVVEYALFQRGHAEPVIDSLLADGFIAIEQGRALDVGNPAWDRLQARLARMARRAPATQPPDPAPADPANERADADVTMDIADDRATPETEPDAAAAQEGREVGGGQAEAYEPTELTNPALVVPLHQLQAIRERATPADLFRARQENQSVRQDDATTDDGAP